MSLEAIWSAVSKQANPEKAKLVSKFFKTGKGEYGEGDKFKGLTVPQCRKIAQENKSIGLKEIEKLIRSSIHEERFIAIVILTMKFKKEEKLICDFYLKHLDWVNNWDLVDCSSYHILGTYLLHQQEPTLNVLFELAKSDDIWRRRVSIISTFAFIRNKVLQPTIEVSKLLLEDEHDLIHKGVGWMLRQVGKRDETLLQLFLKEHYEKIPRTCLRYAIEKFEEDKRMMYLKKQF